MTPIDRRARLAGRVRAVAVSPPVGNRFRQGTRPARSRCAVAVPRAVAVSPLVGNRLRQCPRWPRTLVAVSPLVGNRGQNCAKRPALRCGPAACPAATVSYHISLISAYPSYMGFGTMAGAKAPLNPSAPLPLVWEPSLWRLMVLSLEAQRRPGGAGNY